jgi:hypothetical protein
MIPQLTSELFDNPHEYKGNVFVESIDMHALHDRLDGIDGANFWDDHEGWEAELPRYIGKVAKIGCCDGLPKDIVLLEFSDGYRIECEVDTLEPTRDPLSVIAQAPKKVWVRPSTADLAFMDAAILAFIPMMFKEDDKARGFDFIYSKIDGLVEAAEEILRLKMKRQATLSVCVSDGGSSS